jgi:hypothetical protein
LLSASFRNLSRRATRRLEVHLAHPRRELLLEIRFVDELAPLEERVLDPLHEVLDGSLLVAASRRAHLRADAELEHHLRERRVELLDGATAAALRHDGARTVEHGEQRDTAERREVTHERTDEHLDLLVRHDADGDEARVLQPRGEEVDAPLAAVDEAHVDLTKVVLGELAGQTFEAHDGRAPYGACSCDHRVERALAPA